MLSNFINTNKYSVDFIDVRKYIHRTCTLSQSYRFTWLHKSTGASLRASGVLNNNMFAKAKNFHV